MAEGFSKSDKNYGLPNVELTPIDRDQPAVAKAAAVPPRKEPPKKERRWLPILVLVAVGLIAVSLLYYLFWGSKSTDSDNQTLTQSTQEDQQILEGETSDSPLAAVDSASRSETTEVSEGPANEEVVQEEPGTIVTISERTQRYYIFLGSYKFKAYARRHAERLAEDGFAVKLITPDNWVGMRVAVGNYASAAEASTDAAFIKDKYGNEVVVSKY